MTSALHATSATGGSNNNTSRHGGNNPRRASLRSSVGSVDSNAFSDGGNQTSSGTFWSFLPWTRSAPKGRGDGLWDGLQNSTRSNSNNMGAENNNSMHDTHGYYEVLKIEVGLEI
jgi:hypothetical protein